MDMHDDNRLELIERYKKQLVESTNIKSSPDEMVVIDSILFRFWQMGWLKEQEAVPIDTKMIGMPNGTDIEVFCCPDCRIVLDESFHFCPNCGLAVKWE